MRDTEERPLVGEIMIGLALGNWWKTESDDYNGKNGADEDPQAPLHCGDGLRERSESRMERRSDDISWMRTGWLPKRADW